MGVLPDHRRRYNEVVEALEAAAARGEKVVMGKFLPTLGLKVADWGYTMQHIKSKRERAMVERYQAVMARVRSSGRGPRRDLVSVPRIESAPPPEDGESYDAEALREAMTSEDPPRMDYREEGSPAAMQINLPSRFLEPMPVLTPDLDSETKTLLKVITSLKPHTKEVRDRILGAATVFLGMDAV